MPCNPHQASWEPLLHCADDEAVFWRQRGEVEQSLLVGGRDFVRDEVEEEKAELE